MATLNAAARADLALAGISQAAWARRFYGEPTWRGDVCGCPDDRCIGHHHDVREPCGCLAALLGEV